MLRAVYRFPFTADDDYGADEDDDDYDDEEEEEDSGYDFDDLVEEELRAMW